MFVYVTFLLCCPQCCPGLPIMPSSGAKLVLWAANRADPVLLPLSSHLLLDLEFEINYS